MNTIYWLSVLGMVVGFGIYLTALLFVTTLRKKLPMQDQMIITHKGVAFFLPFRYLLLGVVSLIVFLTI